jgi:UDP-N-acetylglucosamine 1-carboxyvinyltransferase
MFTYTLLGRENLEKFVVVGGKKLQGTIRVSGAKNAVLPILAASMLSSERTCIIEEAPALGDIHVMTEILRKLGAHVTSRRGSILEINTDGMSNCEIPEELSSMMRASFFTVGPLVAKFGDAQICQPGGCVLGPRPIDLHLDGLRTLGAEVSVKENYIKVHADNLRGAVIRFRYPSVGATENVMAAACLADGATVIENAAKEPEVVDLAAFLNRMGAKIEDAGTSTIRIKGVKKLVGARHRVIPDRIEAGTYMVASAITEGAAAIENIVPEHLETLIIMLKRANIRIKKGKESIEVGHKGTLKPLNVTTAPYPGFPTDMQPFFTALLSTANGTSTIIETVFKQRFAYVTELKKMGADIEVRGNSAIIKGVKKFRGADIAATDLRGGAALILAGLAAEGETIIDHIFHIDRGYQNIEEKLGQLGARIYRT